MRAAAARWREALEAWALPQHILDAAPEDPYRTPAALVSGREEWPPEHPTRRPIDAHLPAGGTLLDVGCGAGALAASYRHRAEVVGVEPAERPAAAARAAGVEVLQQRWPAAAASAPVADVVVCTHVWYDVADLAPFVEALTGHARGVVVVELTARHPWAGLGPLYRQFHGLDRPTGPTVEDAVAVVLESVGAPTSIERWQRPGNVHPDLGALVAHRRRQLCLPDSADPEVADAIAGTYETLGDGRVRTTGDDVATLRWAGRAPAGAVRSSGWPQA